MVFNIAKWDLPRFSRLFFVAGLLLSVGSVPAEDAILPGTKPWSFPADIVAEQFQEQRAYAVLLP